VQHLQSGREAVRAVSTSRALPHTASVGDAASGQVGGRGRAPGRIPRRSRRVGRIRPPLGRDAPAPDRAAARPRDPPAAAARALPVPLPAGAGAGPARLRCGDPDRWKPSRLQLDQGPRRRPRGLPVTVDGTSTAAAGLYFCGVPFLRTRRSSVLYGAGQDTAVVAGAVAADLDQKRAPGARHVADVRFCPRWAAADGARGWGRPITHSCPCKGLGCSQLPRFPWSGRTALTDAGAGRDFRPLSVTPVEGDHGRK
jgi:hypothetical protein